MKNSAETKRVSKNRITVVGAGTMGHGIALVFALGGYSVGLVDKQQKQLEQAMALCRSHIEGLKLVGANGAGPQEVLNRIDPVLNSLDPVKNSDLVIEAIVENRHAKTELFRQIADLAGPQTIVASNTSYLNALELVPERLLKKFLIAHFFNPPYTIPLVELVGGEQTDESVIPNVRKTLDELGMICVVLKKFMPGFIVNRLQRAIGREVFYLMDQEVADPIEIDRAVKASLGIRMPVLGAVARYDYAGLDMVRDGLNEAPIKMAQQDNVPDVLNDAVEQGHLGVKTGRGFFSYEGRDPLDVYRERDLKLMEVKKLLADLNAL